MNRDQYAAKARRYLETLCSVKPNRRTGSPGNRAATDFFADTIRAFGYEIDAAPFECSDHVCGGASLTRGEDAFEVHAGPYTLGCDVRAELVVVSTIEELENAACEGRILLLKGEICVEPLMPKNFVFYNPEHHQKTIALLERRKPAAIIAATARSPELAGALYPFPLIADGDFDIPNVCCRDGVGEILAAGQSDVFRMMIAADRIPSSAANVIARLNPDAKKKIVVTAHIDAYEGSPGASDNASGTAVLLLCAEMLAGCNGEYGIEIAALNGEDHYSAGGQMDYLKRYGSEFPGIVLAVNVDDVGYKKGRSSYSFYECTPELKEKAESVFGRFDGLVQGEPWFNGDHMIFVQSGVSCAAFTSECMPELMRTVTHTSSDTPDLVDGSRLVEVAEALNALARSL